MPAAAALGTGKFVVVWASAGGAGGVGIFGKLFVDPAIAVRGKSLRIRDRSDPNKRRLFVLSTDDILDTSPDGGFDPVANGAFLHLYNAMGGPDSACLNLPASGWTASGDPAAPIFRYSDGLYANGACKSAIVKNRKRLRVVCSGQVQPLPYSLDEATQGTVGVRIGSGSTVYCAEFGGTVGQDEPGTFSARKAPDACAVPPVGCP